MKSPLYSVSIRALALAASIACAASALASSVFESRTPDRSGSWPALVDKSEIFEGTFRSETSGLATSLYYRARLPRENTPHRDEILVIVHGL